MSVTIPSKYIKVTYDGTNLSIYDENGTLLTTFLFSGQSLAYYYWLFGGDYGSPIVSGSCILELDTYPSGPSYTQTLTDTEINGSSGLYIPLDYSPQSLDKFTLIGDFRNLTMSGDAPDGDVLFHGFHTDLDGSSVNINIALFWDNFTPPAVYQITVDWRDSLGNPNGLKYTVETPAPPPSPSGPSLSDALSNIITAVSSVIGTIATAIAANAGVIGSIIVVGAVAIGIMGFGQKIFGGLSGWFKGLF